MNQNSSEIIIYRSADGSTKIDVHMENQTVWLSLDQMAELFQRDKSTISRHIKNIFTEGELDKQAVVANFAITQAKYKRCTVHSVYSASFVFNSDGGHYIVPKSLHLVPFFRKRILVF